MILVYFSMRSASTLVVRPNLMVPSALNCSSDACKLLHSAWMLRRQGIIGCLRKTLHEAEALRQIVAEGPAAAASSKLFRENLIRNFCIAEVLPAWLLARHAKFLCIPCLSLLLIKNIFRHLLACALTSSYACARSVRLIPLGGKLSDAGSSPCHRVGLPIHDAHGMMRQTLSQRPHHLVWLCEAGERACSEQLTE